MSAFVKGVSGGSGGLEVTNGVLKKYPAYSGEIEAGTFVETVTDRGQEGYFVKIPTPTSNINGTEQWFHIDTNRWLYTNRNHSGSMELTVVKINKDGTAEFGTTVTMTTRNQVLYLNKLIKISGNDYWLFFSMGSSSYSNRAYRLSINDMTVTADSTIISINKSMKYPAFEVVMLEENKGLMYWIDGSYDDQVAVFTISGNTISFPGNQLELTTEASNTNMRMIAVDSNHVLLVGSYCKLYYLSISDNTVTKLYSDPYLAINTSSNILQVDSNKYFFVGNNKLYDSDNEAYISTYGFYVEIDGDSCTVTHTGELARVNGDVAGMVYICGEFIFSRTNLFKLNLTKDSATAEYLFNLNTGVTGFYSQTSFGVGINYNGILQTAWSTPDYFLLLYPDMCHHSVKPATSPTGIHGITHEKVTSTEPGDIWFLNA